MDNRRCDVYDIIYFSIILFYFFAYYVPYYHNIIGTIESQPTRNDRGVLANNNAQEKERKTYLCKEFYFIRLIVTYQFKCYPQCGVARDVLICI